MSSVVKALVRRCFAEEVDDLGEVVDYLSSLALDLDTSPEDFHESLCGFCPEAKVNIEAVTKVREGTRVLSMFSDDVAFSPSVFEC